MQGRYINRVMYHVCGGLHVIDPHLSGLADVVVEVVNGNPKGNRKAV